MLQTVDWMSASPALVLSSPASPLLLPSGCHFISHLHMAFWKHANWGPLLLALIFLTENISSLKEEEEPTCFCCSLPMCITLFHPKVFHAESTQKRHMTKLSPSVPINPFCIPSFCATYLFTIHHKIHYSIQDPSLVPLFTYLSISSSDCYIDWLNTDWVPSFRRGNLAWWERARLPEFESQLHHLQDARWQANSLNLAECQFFCQMG